MSRFLKVCLVKVQHEGQVSARMYEQSTLLVGRSTDAHIGISDPGVSRGHLEISIKHGRLWVTDLGSANGSFLNGNKLEARIRTAYNPGDIIHLGSQRVAVSIEMYDKSLNERDIKDSALSDEEKENLMQVIQAAHSEAQRISQLVKDQADQMAKSAENKSNQMISQANIRADEIIGAANNEVARMREEAKRAHAEVLLKAETDAEEATRNIFKKADQTLAEAEEKAKEIIRDAEKQGQEIYLKNETEAFDLLQKARKDIQQLRLDWDQERDTLYKESQESIEKREEEARERAKEIVNSADRQKLIILEDANKQFEIAKKEAQERSSQYYQQAETELKASQQRSQQIIFEAREQGDQIIEEKTRAAEKRAREITEEAEEIKRRELKEARKHIETLLTDAQKDIDSTNEKKLSLVRENQSLESKKMELEKQITEETTRLSSVTRDYEDKSLQLKDLETTLSSLETSKKRTSEELQIVKNELTEATEKRKQAVVEFDQVRQEGQRLKEQAQVEAQQLQDQARKEIESYKKREAELLDQMKLEELQRLKEFRAEADKALSNHSTEMINELIRLTEAHMLTLVKPKLPAEFDWDSVSNKLQSEVIPTLEEMVYKFTHTQQVKETEKIVSKKVSRFSTRLRRSIIAAGIAIIVLMSVPTTRTLIVGYLEQNGMHQASKDFSREMAEERARRYNPTKEPKWHESYSDSVLYTQGFTELKLDAQYQDQWIRDLHEYLYRELRIDEDSIVKAVSLEAALVTKLKEQADQIHPDYVTEHVKKMKEQEQETVKELTAIMGTEKKYKQFLKFSEDYYYNNYLQRQPAQNRQ